MLFNMPTLADIRMHDSSLVESVSEKKNMKKSTSPEKHEFLL